VRHALDKEQLALFWPLEQYGGRARPLEQLLAKRRRKLVTSRLCEGQDSQLG
jgi:hypothetical protein